MASLLVLGAAFVCAQQRRVSLQGRVHDATGKHIPRATITVTPAQGAPRTVHTDRTGTYSFRGLPSGQYTIRAAAPGFESYQGDTVAVPLSTPLDLTLHVAARKEQVTIVGRQLNIEPDNNASAIVLRSEQLRSLPDLPGDFAAALQALAGPSALGPSGPQIFVNNLTSNHLPPKQTIRDVRINQTPFSAQYDRPGFNRIEVFTKEGESKLHGETRFNISDSRLNARNPFQGRRTPHQFRLFGADLGGALVRERSFFFATVERAETDSGGVIDAVALDPALDLTRFQRFIAAPERRTAYNYRSDNQLHKSNLLSVRYDGIGHDWQRLGSSSRSLPESGHDTTDFTHTLQVRDTATFSAKVLNETRFQYIWARSQQTPQVAGPAIQVPDAFSGGGAPTGRGRTAADRWEFQNYILISPKRHAMRIGMRLRGNTSLDFSPKNFNGTYTFSAGMGPLLDSAHRPVADASGQPVQVPLTALERYRRTLLLAQAGFTPSQIRALGGGPSELSLTAGNPLTEVSQGDLGLFAHDDWRVRPGLALSFGLRFEAQTNLRGSHDFAPRLALAWMPGASHSDTARTVLRAGWGLFYDRVTDALLLQIKRGSGMRRVYNVTDPALLDAFPNLPALDLLSPFVQPQVAMQMARDLRPASTMQTMLSLERHLFGNTTLSATATYGRTRHALRGRLSEVLAYTAQAPLLQVEAAGHLEERRLLVDVNSQASKRFNFTATYTWNYARSDTDGPLTLPALLSDLCTEYGRADKDIRHNLTLTGTVQARWGWELSPFLVASSNRPFNIFAGQSLPSEMILPERPARATDPTAPGVIQTPYGLFALNPLLGQSLIPRNSGSGPAFLSVNFRLTRAFHLSRGQRNTNAAQSVGAEQRYRITVALQALNLLNHLNPGLPNGDLRSPQFGQATDIAKGFNFGGDTPALANRRLEAQLRFQF